MSTYVPPRPRLLLGKRNFTIVASRFNAEFVQGLVDHAANELRTCAPSAHVHLEQVPGAFEIPVVVRELAMQKKADAIIALGLILKGQTNHADHLGRSVTNALQMIAIEHGVPVINAVLTVENEDQARARCLEEESNRGTEAARAAIEVASVMSGLREK